MESDPDTPSGGRAAWTVVHTDGHDRVSPTCQPDLLTHAVGCSRAVLAPSGRCGPCPVEGPHASRTPSGPTGQPPGGASAERPRHWVLWAEPACPKQTRVSTAGSQGAPYPGPPLMGEPGGPRAAAGALTHFEVGGLQRRAGEQPGEDHVYGDGQAATNVSVSDLNILNLRGVPGVSLCTPCVGGQRRAVREQRVSRQAERQSLGPL